ncbi:MAG: ABC transporter permease [Eggerthellaceae bacterium]|nr:ABC transporter permease [Eggerthellaceae bacterium]
MRNTLALTRRILQQFAHDKRTIALFIIGPILILWLFSVLLNTGTYYPTLVCVNLPSELTDALKDEQATCLEQSDVAIAQDLLKDRKADAVLTLKDGVLTVQVEGADPSKTGSVVSTVQSAVKAAGTTQREEAQATIKSQVDDMKTQMESFKGQLSDLMDALSAAQAALAASGGGAPNGGAAAGIPPQLSATPSLELPNFDTIDVDIQPLVDDVSITYLHGNDSWGTFDFFGPVFIGIFIFIFVFITSGMSLVTERTGGTMERLLVTPIKPYQLVLGFCLGFGVVTVVQAAIVLWACVTLIGFPNEGSLVLVAFVAFSMAMVSLTLGLVVSAVAKTPFQVIQFMLILVIPQVLLSGIFDLSNAPAWMQVLSACFPISHGAEALRDIMLRGSGLAETGVNIAVLWGFIVAFFTIATLSFRRRKTS